MLTYLQCCDEHEYGKKHDCRKPHPDALRHNAAHVVWNENFVVEVIAAAVGPASVGVALHARFFTQPFALAIYGWQTSDSSEVEDEA